ncbi:hypothetical protein [Methylobacterium segetis]|uniref:hypothetical protein n=1 Tax=Methylobacterium segetis TaxID=2488750 RepID=UPI001FE0A121|nr:hypothetical protein [Methylobacterium segetis]
MSHLHAGSPTLVEVLPPTEIASLPPQARSRPYSEPAPTRIIEVGETTAGIAVPEHGGVRFFSSSRDFDALDGTVFRSVEQAARAARERVRRGAHRPRHEAARRLQAV